MAARTLPATRPRREIRRCTVEVLLAGHWWALTHSIADWIAILIQQETEYSRGKGCRLVYTGDSVTWS